MATIDFVVKNGLVVNENAVILETTDSSDKDSGALVVEGGVGIEKKLYVGTDLAVGSNTTLTGDLAVNGGDITTSQATFNLLNTTVTSGNLFGAGTAVSIGAATGTTTINNASTVVTGDLAVNGGDITTSQTTFNLLNTTVTTGNLFGAGTAVNIGAATGTTTIKNTAVTLDGTTLNINGTNPAIASSNTGTASIFNANIATINLGQAADISMGGTAKTVTVRGAFAVDGNTTLGNASSDTITFNGTVLNVPNTLTFTVDDAINNNISYPIEVRHTTTGTPAANIGTGIEFITETANNNNEIGVTVEGQAVGVASGAENFDFVVRTMTSGATAVQAIRANTNTFTVGASSTATTINTQTSSALTITTGATGVTGVGNTLTVQAGVGGVTSGNGGALSVTGGDASTSGTGGTATIRAGNATGANIVGANTTIEAGQGTGTGRSGHIIFRTGPAGTAGSSRNTLSTVLTLNEFGLDVPGDIVINGNLTVNGTTTTVNSNTLSVDDKNIELGATGSGNFNATATITAGSAIITALSSTANIIPGSAIVAASGVGTVGIPAGLRVVSVNSATQITVNQALTGTGSAAGAILTFSGATDFTADGGGITLKGTTDKTFNWISSTGHWTGNVNISAPALVSTVATGTAPLTVASTTLVTNLNADLLDGQNGTYYLDWTNVTNKPDPVVTVTLTGDVTGTANTTLTDLASGTVSVATTIAANSVALGTDTTGNYMADVSAGTGISISHTAGEGSTATITNSGVTSAVSGNAIIVSAATGAVTINHADTSTVSDVAAATNQFVTGITFDTYGHVQTVTRGSPSGFLTAEADTLATVTARGATTSTACTFNGNVNIGGFVAFGLSPTVTAAGTTQADATLLTSSINHVTTVSANTGVRFPAPALGTRIIVRNGGASALRVYPNVGAQINTAGNNVAFTLNSGVTLEFIAFSTTQWYTVNATFA